MSGDIDKFRQNCVRISDSEIGKNLNLRKNLESDVKLDNHFISVLNDGETHKQAKDMY